MLRKGILVLCIGLIFMIPCGYFGALIFSNTITIETTSSDISSGDLESYPIDIEDLVHEEPSIGNEGTEDIITTDNNFNTDVVIDNDKIDESDIEDEDNDKCLIDEDDNAGDDTNEGTENIMTIEKNINSVDIAIYNDGIDDFDSSDETIKGGVINGDDVDDIDTRDSDYEIKAIIIPGNDVLFLIDQIIDKIQASDDECWRNPGINRKLTMIEKLNELKELVSSDNFEEAYDKLLHDIKPKLTGLRFDENGEQWGNGEFKNPWVQCIYLQDEFESDCNDILSRINQSNQSI